MKYLNEHLNAIMIILIIEFVLLLISIKTNWFHFSAVCFLVGYLTCVLNENMRKI